LSEPLRVAYLGPEGTFSESAALRSAPADAALEPIPMPTIYDAAEAVVSGLAGFAVVPIENSIEGSVNATLDLLAFDTPDISIVGETVLPVQQCLIARSPIDLAEIEVVISHPQATAQCARFIREKLPAARVMTASSTADAVRLVSERIRHRWAAIGTELAAELYHCSVLSTGIEDHGGNQTRFVWLGPTGSEITLRDAGSEPGPEPAYKTAIVFWGSGSESAGWLVRCLTDLSSRGVNMSRIESRPLRQQLGQYLFFIDLEGRSDDPSVAAAMAALQARVQTLKVLGCFPTAVTNPGAGGLGAAAAGSPSDRPPSD
jgi:prephenate dehydratase